MVLTKEDVVSALRTCVDPEIPLNIVDLGLVYDVDLAESSAGSQPGSEVTVKMTLTSSSCPMSRSIAADVQKRVLGLPGVSRAKVDLVWEPTWRPDMITAEGRRHLNLA